MKTDYPELEGKIIDWVFKSGRTIKGKVIGCNYNLGITIIQENDPTIYLSCYNGRFSPFFKDKNFFYSGKIYRKLFFQRIKEIKKGISTWEDRRNIIDKVSHNPKNIFCVFKN